MQKTEQLTTSYGRPLGDRSSVMTVGARGPLLLSDFAYIEDIQRFDRERVPERVVHAKGSVIRVFSSVKKFVSSSSVVVLSVCSKQPTIFLIFAKQKFSVEEQTHVF